VVVDASDSTITPESQKYTWARRHRFFVQVQVDFLGAVEAWTSEWSPFPQSSKSKLNSLEIATGDFFKILPYLRHIILLSPHKCALRCLPLDLEFLSTGADSEWKKIGWIQCKIGPWGDGKEVGVLKKLNCCLAESLDPCNDRRGTFIASSCYQAALGVTGSSLGSCRYWIGMLS
jgi:hypothetical protein